MEGVTNAVSTSSGGNKEIKILNVVQTGTLTRDGAVFSGFSGSNYLAIGGVVDNNILAITNNANYKSLDTIFSNDFEINGSADNVLTKATTQSCLFCCQTQSKGIVILVTNANGYIRFNLYYNSNNNSITTTIQSEKVYFRLKKVGTNYKFYVNTDGQTYDSSTLVNEQTVTEDLSASKRYYIGICIYYSSIICHCDIDLTDWNIKVNGEYWWKGVETLTL